LSMIELLASFVKNFSEISHFEPKVDGLEVKVSFVCESKAGFSIRQFMKAHRFCLT
jgi:hypothetical protein